MAKITFNLNQLKELDGDLRGSKKALPLIVRKVLIEKFRQLRTALRAEIPRSSGRLQRSFGFTTRQRQGLVTGRFGFMINRRMSKSTIIAGNVQQAGRATPRKSGYLWIPIGQNRNAEGGALVSPRDLLSSGGFVQWSKAGNKIAFRGTGEVPTPYFLLKREMNIGRPVPINQRVEAALPEMMEAIPEMINQVIAARKSALQLS